VDASPDKQKKGKAREDKSKSPRPKSAGGKDKERPKSAKGAKKSGGVSEQKPKNSVILLADQYLLELPLEALQVLRAQSIDSIGRDISLQFLLHRFRVDPGLFTFPLKYLIKCIA